MMKHYSMRGSGWKPCRLPASRHSQTPAVIPITCTSAEAKHHRSGGATSTSGRFTPSTHSADAHGRPQDDEEPAMHADRRRMDQPTAARVPEPASSTSQEAGPNGKYKQHHRPLQPEDDHRHPDNQQPSEDHQVPPRSRQQRSPRSRQQPRRYDGPAPPQRHDAQQPLETARRQRQRQQPLRAPPSPTFRAADKAYLKPEQRAELARKLRRPDPAAAAAAARPPLRVFRHAIDDLRLFCALEAAGLAGRVVVVDSMQDADAVVATRHKRTGKDVSLVEVRRAAGNARLPFFELEAVSALRVAQALAPLMGLGVPAHLLRPCRAADAGRLPRLASLPSPGAAAAAGPEARLRAGPEAQSFVPLVVPDPAAARSSLGGGAPSDLLDAVDASEDRRAQLPTNPYELQGTRHALKRQGAPNGRARRRKLLREMQEDSAPW